MTSGKQFDRSIALVVANQVEGSDLSQLRIRFQVYSADVETPNTAYIRVYNLKDSTARRIINEYDNVILQVGYQGNTAIIFRGTIKQFKRGKERNVDSYLEIMAADGDLGYNFGVVNTTLVAGSTPQQRLDTLSKTMQGLTVDAQADSALTGGVLPRGKVLFGLARNYLRELAVTSNARWSIQNGTIVIIPLNGYLPGQAVKINSLTGMVGIPEATDNGIQVRVLCNPLIKIGTSIELNNRDVTQTIVKEQFFPNYASAPTLIATVDELDGIYRVLVAEQLGDTRELEWYTDLVCLKIDASSNMVKPYG